MFFFLCSFAFTSFFFLSCLSSFLIRRRLPWIEAAPASMKKRRSGKKKWKNTSHITCFVLLCCTHISRSAQAWAKRPRVCMKSQSKPEWRFEAEEEEVRWLNVELSTSLFSLLLPILLLHFDFFSLLVSQPFHSTHSATCQCAQIETFGSEICVALLLRAHSPICLFKCLINEKNKHRLWKC